MNNRLTIKISLSLLGVLLSCSSYAAGDAEKGKQLFSQCAICHTLGSDAKHSIGPKLNNVIGAVVASQNDYQYSSAFLQAAENGLVWNSQTLYDFLSAPAKYIPNNKMGFVGLSKSAERLDVIAYLANFSGQQTEQEIIGFTISDAVLTLRGDAEYGEYLSSECTTCHQLSGNNDGIPNIMGLDKDAFVIAMHAYREKHRSNPVMQLVAGRLSNEEIASLAEYFNNL